MDYQTKPTSRKKLRVLSKVFRAIFGLNEIELVPVLKMLEKLPDVLGGTNYIVVEDWELPENIPARCYLVEGGHFVIEIKNSIYMGAYKNIGWCRGIICHEICHVFLYKIGFTPIWERSFENNELPAYCSVEWQTKALCGEVMMPYEQTKNMTQREIMEKYQVSKGFAKTRQHY